MEKINGKPIFAIVTERHGQTYSVCAVEVAHELWAKFLDICGRFERGAGIASAGVRARLETKSGELGEQAKRLYFERSPLAGAVMNRMVRLEEELGALAADAPLAESFYVRRAPWAPSEERIDGDSFDLEQSANEAEAEAMRLRFELHRVRKSTSNRVELAKAGLVSRFSWREAWAETKAQMRELGREIRQEESWARKARRELLLRQREVDALDRLGEEVNSDWKLPSEDEECARCRREEGRA